MKKPINSISLIKRIKKFDWKTLRFSTGCVRQSQDDID